MTDTIIVSLIVGTITALAVQLFIERVVSRIKRIESRVADLTRHLYEQETTHE